MKFKRFLFTFLFLLASFSSSVSATPYHWNCGTFTVDATDTLITCPFISTNYIYFTITNTTPSNMSVRQLINSVNFPAGWSFNMCNPNGCWSPSVLVDTFLVPASNSVTARFDFHVDTTSGNGIANVRFDDSASPAVNGATFDLYAFSLTPLSVSVVVTDASICAGETAFISALASGGDGNYTYTWIPSLPNSPGPHIISPVVTTVYNVFVTDGSGTPAAVDTITVVVHPQPIALFNAINTAGCVPLNACFADLSGIMTGDTITQWLWDFGDGSPSDTNQNPCHIYSVPSAPNSYSVTLTTTSNAGCSSSFTINNYVAAYPMPSATFIVIPQYVWMNQPVTFHSYNDSSVTYNWDFGDGYYSTSPNPLHYYLLPGNYLACLMASNNYGCADTVCDTIYVVTGIDEASNEANSLILYPNPVSTELTIYNLQFTIKELEISNSIGEKVFEVYLSTDIRCPIINVSDFPPGIYFVRLKMDQGFRSAKFVKE